MRWFASSPRGVGLGLVLGLSLLSAQPVLALSDSEEFEHRIAQGRFYFDQEMFSDAVLEFEQAQATSEGQISADLWVSLARTYWELSRISDAMNAINRAVRIVGSDEESQGVRDFYEFLTQSFGRVTIDVEVPNAAPPEPMFPVVDPRVRGVVEQVQTLVTDAPPGPLYFIYLPVGRWQSGGEEIEVVSSRSIRMTARAPGAAPPSQEEVYEPEQIEETPQQARRRERQEAREAEARIRDMRREERERERQLEEYMESRGAGSEDDDDEEDRAVRSRRQRMNR